MKGYAKQFLTKLGAQSRVECELDLPIEEHQARTDLTDANRFVRRVEGWLKQEDWL